MTFMDDDSRGFAFSLDLLLAIIPLTILLGMFAADMGNMLSTVESTVYQSSTERVGADTVNTLVRTSGNPTNWEDTGVATIAGLAKFDSKKNMPVHNFLSNRKIVALEKSDVESLIGPQYDFYMTITTLESTPRTLKSLGTYDSSKNNIIRIERLVISSQLEIKTSLVGVIRDSGGNRTYTTTFPTNNFEINSYDYWVMVVSRGYNSVTVEINNNNVIFNNDTFNQGIIRRQINKTFLNETNNIVNVKPVSNPGASMDVYIIAAPPGTPEQDINIDNVVPKKCRFLFFIWSK